MQGNNRNGFDVEIAQAGAGVHEGMNALVRRAGRAGDHIAFKENAGRVARTGVFFVGAVVRINPHDRSAAFISASTFKCGLRR